MQIAPTLFQLSFCHTGQTARFCLKPGVDPILLNNIRLPHGNGLLSLHGFAYSLCLKPALGDYFGSLVYALLFVALNWGIGYTLYKRKIYIKI